MESQVTFDVVGGFVVYQWFQFLSCTSLVRYSVTPTLTTRTVGCEWICVLILRHCRKVTVILEIIFIFSQRTFYFFFILCELNFHTDSGCVGQNDSDLQSAPIEIVCRSTVLNS